MNAAAAERSRTLRPLALRIAEAIGAGPLVLSTGAAILLWVALAVLTVASGAAGQLSSGTAPAELVQDFRVAIVLTLILAYLPGVQALIARRAERSLRELAPVLDLAPEGMESWVHRIGRVDPRTHRRACWHGLAGVFALAFLPEIFAERSLGIVALPAISVSHRFMVAAIGMLAGSAIAFSLSSSGMLAELTRERGRLDLFDLRPWSPLVRLGLTNAFANAGLMSLLLLMLPDRDAGVGLAGALVAMMGAIAILAGFGLVLPLQGLRGRIRAEKQARLTAFHRELTEVLSDTAPATGRLADLTAYKRLLDGVSEWPIDLPQIARFSLLFGLPVLSWIAAALVERLLDAVIG